MPKVRTKAPPTRTTTKKKAKMGLQIKALAALLFICFGVMICSSVSFHVNHSMTFNDSTWRDENNFIHSEHPVKQEEQQQQQPPPPEESENDDGENDEDDTQEEEEPKDEKANDDDTQEEEEEKEPEEEDDESEKEEEPKEGEVIKEDIKEEVEEVEDAKPEEVEDDEVEEEVKNSQTTQTLDYRHETNVFQKIVDRITLTNHTCQNLPEHHLGPPPVKDFDTGVPPLPENGVYYALKEWLDKEKDGQNDRMDYPMCELPPMKECDVDQVSVILMSHTVDDYTRLQAMTYGIAKLSKDPDVAEIIIVWNAERSVLESSTQENAQRLIKWAQDETHPLRIFYSFDNGLENNLLNRYHPAIKPTQKAIVYFDDDGPFFGKGVMNTGFELWKFNSDVQCGSMTRNIRFHSDRMMDVNVETQTLAIQQYSDDAWQVHTHPYDTSAVEAAMALAGEDDPNYPPFTPICHDETGDLLEYNFFVFPPFNSHMSLPSGSFLHRDYLCFVWHPAFEELRQFILDHPTHPDDMTISTIVTHLSGKPIRTFPRRIAKGTPPPVENEPEKDSTKRRKLRSVSINEETDADKNIEIEEDVQFRRKLLWQQKDWANMREEAINSVVGYFGSINSGSVGWCTGTEFQKGNHRDKKNRKDSIVCDPEFPYESQIPWMNEGGQGFDQCN